MIRRYTCPFCLPPFMFDLYSKMFEVTTRQALACWISLPAWHPPLVNGAVCKAWCLVVVGFGDMCFYASPTGDRSRVYYEDRNRVSPAPGKWAGPEAGTAMTPRRKAMIWWIAYSHLESN
jgi:hypothetical protein